MTSQCSHQVSLLHHTSRPYSHPGGQQEGDCWLDLPQTEPLLQPTASSPTTKGNWPGDGASEADQPVAPDGAEGRQLTLPRLLPREMPRPNLTIVPGPDVPVQWRWLPNITAVGGEGTLSMCSRSTTDTRYRLPTGRESGLGRENVSSTTSPQGRLRWLLLRKRLL